MVDTRALNIEAALSAARAQLSASASAALDAQLLLMAALGVARAYLLAHGEVLLTAEQAAHYEQLVARAAQGEPIPYILGKRAFFDFELLVTPAVLIPRPETELLLEAALDFARENRVQRAVDVGTGSGALAVGLARHVPGARVFATEISSAALAVALRNAARYELPIDFMQGDLLAPLIERGLQVDLLLANLPYIPSAEVPTLAVSRYEPLPALDGGADGLDIIRRLLAQAPTVCRAGACLLLEIGAGQGDAVAQAAWQALRPQSCAVLPDYAGHERIVRIIA